MKTIFKTLLTFTLMLLFSGCAGNVQTNMQLSKVYSAKENITLFALKNYTDTPQAGLRASNILEGILLAHGYSVTNHIQEDEKNMDDMRAIATKEGSKYLLYGGVSEWRYKTGIDGEPAVSLKCVLVEAQTGKVVWSATASDNAWGNGSIGTTAQSLIETMLKK
jgi:TolB-like protein